MNILEYENYHENKNHVNPIFPYNTYLCSIPLDFTYVPTHWHDEIEFINIKKGCGLISVDFIEYSVSSGNIIIVLPGQLHSIRQQDQQKMEYENIFFQIPMLVSKLNDFCEQHFFTPMLQRQTVFPTVINHNLDYYDDLIYCINQIDTLCSTQPYCYQLALKGYLYQFFYILFSNNTNSQIIPKTKTSIERIERIKQIVKYIELHYSEQLTVQTMADYCRLSRSYFMKFFKQTMGTGFTEYLNNYRLTMISRLLLTSSNTILSIVLDCGFENLSYFNRLFKQKYGVTPRQYRNI